MPPLSGFRWVVIRRENQLLLPRRTVTLFDHSGSGYFVFAYLETDTPELEIVVDVESDGSIDIDLSPQKLYNVGATAPSPGSAYLTRYDEDCTENCKYIAMYTPATWLPFSKRSVARIYNPTLHNANYTFVAYLYVSTGETRIGREGAALITGAGETTAPSGEKEFEEELPSSTGGTVSTPVVPPPSEYPVE